MDLGQREGIEDLRRGIRSVDEGWDALADAAALLVRSGVEPRTVGETALQCAEAVVPALVEDEGNQAAEEARIDREAA